ncbi:NUDIX hydrolase domain-like protein [Rhodocollybia butyracea]|uniref:NUDIX hydrolase domain-like protein n=1 Tax=Rhodocollybia butyracea TaxID=206335 RepID=A0A9P5P788_9AGAR|nr:NUDIX hydrolase domain-like protein [Rhodocollybia butyracea]
MALDNPLTNGSATLAAKDNSRQTLDHLPLDPGTRELLERLQAQGIDQTDLSSHLPKRLAAVLVLLYSHAGVLRVLLSTRSKLLRSHPGQTALPGGRVDEGDKDAIETAFREANEEVGLPFPSSLSTSDSASLDASKTTAPDIHTLCTLSPHLSQWGIVVTPVIAYLSSPSAHEFLQSSLTANPDEVDRIFTHPLEAVLDPQIVAKEAEDGLVVLAERGTEDWPYEEEFYSTADRLYPDLGNTVYRMHRFRSTASPIKGLTAEILIRVASIAFDRPPTPPIEQYAPDQIRGFAEMRDLMDKFGRIR